MANFVIIGKRLIPPEHIALVEPYEPSAQPRIQTTRDFKARVVMVNRDSILIEEPAAAFAEANSFRMLPDDRVATNPAVRFRVETFTAMEGFTPAKAYASRLLWRDLDGNDQSKLLLSEAETVLAVAVRGETPPEVERAPRAIRVNRKGQAVLPRTPATHP